MCIGGGAVAALLAVQMASNAVEEREDEESGGYGGHIRRRTWCSGTAMPYRCETASIDGGFIDTKEDLYF